MLPSQGLIDLAWRVWHVFSPKTLTELRSMWSIIDNDASSEGRCRRLHAIF